MHERKVEVVESGQGPLGLTISSGRHTMTADEPVALGGLDSGPDPFEHLLAALGACTAMTIRLYAQRKKFALDHVSVVLRHTGRATTQAPDVFDRQITMTGALSAEERARLLEIAEKCPVSLTLKRGSTVTTSAA